MKKNILILASIFLGASLTSMAQTKYPDKKKGSTGSVTFTHQGEKVTYQTIRANDGKIWLQQNLGSSQVATSAGDKEAYGDMHVWGRWADGHEVRQNTPVEKKTLNPNNPKGLNLEGTNPFYTSQHASGYWWSKGDEYDTWNKADKKDASAKAGVDPCRSLGDRWRMPTEAEWSKVLRTEKITDSRTAFDSNLKLPMAGFRAAKTGIISGEGKMGRYWTATAANKGNAHLVNIVSNGVDLPAYSRSGGLSVRCICEK